MDFIAIFIECLNSIKHQYSEFNFYCERDFVWTIQKFLKKYIEDNKLPFKVMNDFPVESGGRRSKSADIAIIHKDLGNRDVLNGKGQAELIIEFKFEPSRLRTEELCIHKLPVVQWSEVLADIGRIHRFIDKKLAKYSVAVLVDELGRHKIPQHKINDSIWIDWGNLNSEKLNVTVLYTEVK